jgi:hypothetical protein
LSENIVENPSHKTLFEKKKHEPLLFTMSKQIEKNHGLKNKER